MPRWRALPDELDPQIAEFTGQLRRLIDRSGMSVATIADRTGYSKSSWERYLNGRLLPPRGATQALAEVTGTDVRHLGTMWELAERAWSRSEMRHDVTMEAIQVAQARAALGEGEGEAGHGRRRRRKGAGSSAPQQGAAEPPQSASTAGPVAPPAAGVGAGDDQTTVLRRSNIRAEAGRQPPRTHAAVAPPLGVQRIDPASWGAAPKPGPTAPPANSGPAPVGSAAPPVNSGPAPAGSAAPAPAPDKAQQPAHPGRRRTTMFLAGTVSALVVVAAAVFVSNLSGGKGEAAPAPSSSHKGEQDALPSGVQCSGAECTGKDPETMGCGGQYAKTTGTAWVGSSYVEVRHSTVCKASWARITSATTGDSLKISAGGHTEQDEVEATNDAYTPMVATTANSPARACATLAAGGRGCTGAE
ncbi:helix-turn-helix domain-containing protein [Streptomyces sulphureus]|uniref:helix-turn-helix domain-containing protein n=1 Tax=Streptomyces sulphureus TaxID=47758 RepID=UPI00037FC02B|nr:XRE family transcriptional regulator [Streptomyces sulphureus]